MIVSRKGFITATTIQDLVYYLIHQCPLSGLLQTTSSLLISLIQVYWNVAAAVVRVGSMAGIVSHRSFVE